MSSHANPHAAPGPHRGKVPHYIDAPGLDPIRTGHPDQKLQDETVSHWTNSHADHPWHSPDASSKLFNRLYDKLVEANVARGGTPPDAKSVAAARKLIDEYVMMGNKGAVNGFMNRKGPNGESSYVETVTDNYIRKRDNGAWSPWEIDADYDFKLW